MCATKLFGYARPKVHIFARTLENIYIFFQYLDVAALKLPPNFSSLPALLLLLLLLSLWPRKPSALQHVHDVVASVISILHDFFIEDVHREFRPSTRFPRPFRSLTFATVVIPIFTVFPSFTVTSSGLLLAPSPHLFLSFNYTKRAYKKESNAPPSD